MSVDDLEKARNEPTDNLLVNSVEENELLPQFEVEDLNKTLLIVPTRKHLVEGYQHHCFLIECVRLDLAVWMLLLFEENVRLEVAEHNIDFLEAEMVLKVLPIDKFIFGQE